MIHGILLLSTSACTQSPLPTGPPRAPSALGAWREQDATKGILHIPQRKDSVLVQGNPHYLAFTPVNLPVNQLIGVFRFPRGPPPPRESGFADA
jgi:hypothetical protein